MILTMRILNLLILCTALLAQPATAQLAKSSAISWIEAGIICASDTGEYREAPGTISGRAHAPTEEPPFVSNSQVVPAVRGVGLGVKARSDATIGMLPIEMILTHPPMGEDGITRQTFVSLITPDRNAIIFFQFDHDYELVTGPWSFTAMRDGQTVFRANFQVVSPDEMPDLADTCDYRDLLS